MKNIEDVRQSVKAAAAELFGKAGYDKTSLEDIARRVGKTKTFVYYHFPGKLAVLDATLQDEFDGIRRQLEDVLAAYRETGPEQLEAYVDRRMNLIVNAPVYRAFTADRLKHACTDVSRTVNRRREAFDQWEREYFRRLCQTGIDRGILSGEVDPDSFAEMTGMLLNGLEWYFLSAKTPETARATFHKVVHHMVTGLLTQEGQKHPGGPAAAPSGHTEGGETGTGHPDKAEINSTTIS